MKQLNLRFRYNDAEVIGQLRLGDSLQDRLADHCKGIRFSLGVSCFGQKHETPRENRIVSQLSQDS